MEKTSRLIKLLLIFIPLILLALLAGTIGLIIFLIQRWKADYLTTKYCQYG